MSTALAPSSSPQRAPVLGAERSTLRLGIIGLGHWGPNHLRVFSSLPGAGLCLIALYKFPAIAAGNGFLKLAIAGALMVPYSAWWRRKSGRRISTSLSQVTVLP